MTEMATATAILNNGAHEFEGGILKIKDSHEQHIRSNLRLKIGSAPIYEKADRFSSVIWWLTL